VLVIPCQCVTVFTLEIYLHVLQIHVAILPIPSVIDDAQNGCVTTVFTRFRQSRITSYCRAFPFVVRYYVLSLRDQTVLISDRD